LLQEEEEETMVTRLHGIDRHKKYSTVSGNRARRAEGERVHPVIGVSFEHVFREDVALAEFFESFFEGRGICLMLATCFSVAS
jgi:hypothetical protein